MGRGEAPGRKLGASRLPSDGAFRIEDHTKVGWLQDTWERRMNKGYFPRLMIPSKGMEVVTTLKWVGMQAEQEHSWKQRSLG